MSVSYQQIGGQDTLTFAGTLSLPDLAEVKRLVATIPRSTGVLRVDIRELGGLNTAQVQFMLALVRYCRSLPRPVEFVHSTAWQEVLALWGLKHAGWEAFFHE